MKHYIGDNKDCPKIQGKKKRLIHIKDHVGLKTIKELINTSDDEEPFAEHKNWTLNGMDPSKAQWYLLPSIPS